MVLDCTRSHLLLRIYGIYRRSLCTLEAKDVKRALTELYPLTARDLLVDIGAGDGLILRMASKLGRGQWGTKLTQPLLC